MKYIYNEHTPDLRATGPQRLTCKISSASGSRAPPLWLVKRQTCEDSLNGLYFHLTPDLAWKNIHPQRKVPFFPLASFSFWPFAKSTPEVIRRDFTVYQLHSNVPVVWWKEQNPFSSFYLQRRLPYGPIAYPTTLIGARPPEEAIEKLSCRIKASGLCGYPQERKMNLHCRNSRFDRKILRHLRRLPRSYTLADNGSSTRELGGLAFKDHCYYLAVMYQYMPTNDNGLHGPGKQSWRAEFLDFTDDVTCSLYLLHQFNMSSQDTV